MAPVAYGFLILIAGAAVLGVVVGAAGGAVAWRFGLHVVLGGALTLLALPVALLVAERGGTDWLRAELTWGAPALAVAYLTASVLARWLAARTRLGPTGTALVALALSLVLGIPYLMLFRVSPGAPLVAAPAAAVVLIVLLVRSRRKAVPSG